MHTNLANPFHDDCEESKRPVDFEHNLCWLSSLRDRRSGDFAGDTAIVCTSKCLAFDYLPIVWKRLSSNKCAPQNHNRNLNCLSLAVRMHIWWSHHRLSAHSLVRVNFAPTNYAPNCRAGRSRLAEIERFCACEGMCNSRANTHTHTELMHAHVWHVVCSYTFMRSIRSI